MTRLASIGGSGGSFQYDPEDPVATREAVCKALQMTPEQYDKVHAELDKKSKEFQEKYPYLHNLMWVNDEMYYQIDGKRVEVGDRLEQIKKEMGAAFDEVASETCTVVLADGAIELTKEQRKELLGIN